MNDSERWESELLDCIFLPIYSQVSALDVSFNHYVKNKPLMENLNKNINKKQNTEQVPKDQSESAQGSLVPWEGWHTGNRR